MKTSKTEKINNKTFEFTQLSPRSALPIYTFLMPLIGRTITGIGSSIKNFDDLKGIQDLLNQGNVNLKTLGDSICEALEKIEDNPKIEQYIDTLLSSVIHNGSVLNLDSLVFQGNFLLLNKVIIKAVEVNFSDFFEGNGGLGGLIQKSRPLDTQSA